MDRPLTEPNLTPGDLERKQPIAAITQVFNECVNYASWQNSVPFLQSLEIQNLSSEAITDVRLEMTMKPGAARSKRWVIERIAPGSSISLTDRHVELDPEYLNGLNEAERGQISLRLLRGTETLIEQLHDVRILARDEWGGINAMGELLAAFVMPNDPAIARVLKAAGEVLASHGHSSALDGYQSRDPRRAYLLTAAIWSAVAAEGLTYANPPRSFEQAGQKTRRPSTVLADGLGTCLDTTLLFAAAIEAVGLNPVIIFQHGHCFVGAWLSETTFGRLVETDCSEVRKAITAHEFVTFETTLITHRPPAGFVDAVNTAAAATREAEEKNFIAAIDIARARMAQIRPLASHAPANTPASDSAEPPARLPLPPLPEMGAVPHAEAEEKPTTPAGRTDRWQRKLLDLTLRNRLLNFKDSKTAVPFLCPDIPLLEDRLAAGASLRVISLAEHNPVGDRDVELHYQRTKQDLDAEFALSALQRDEVTSTLQAHELTARLTELYRRCRNDLAEGGSNTLFLAVGFLRWKYKPDDAKSYRAPLLLVPVKLVRRSALSAYQLLHHEDEVRFNSTLIQLLKNDFERDLTRFDTDLPRDVHGIDVPAVLERMRRAVRDVPGFEVIDESALSTFSFAKYLMWKDLVDRIDQLEKNRVVRHLIRDPDKPFAPAVSTSIPAPQEIDSRYSPHDLVHPLPADSSQLAAVMAAAEEQDFVLVGPPGTGKSQTIANMIAQCLANKKTVLFVAEKTAALDVVYRRLRENGLGDFCLELHSNKAERRKFLDQMKAAWDEGRAASANQWLTVSKRLKLRRDELNQYVAALHATDSSGWTVFRAMGVSVRGRNSACPELDWPASVRHDATAYQNLLALVDELALTFEAVAPHAELPFVNATEWSVGWETQLIQHADSVAAASRAFQASLADFTASLGADAKEDCSLEELSQLRRLAQALLATADEDHRIVFHKQFKKLPHSIDALDSAISAYNAARSRTSGTYDEQEVPLIPVNELDQQWRNANASFWPKSAFSRRRVRRVLQTYAASGKADPQVDLPAIRVMQEQLACMDANPLAGQTPHWQKQRTDVAAIRRHLEKAQEARQAIIELGPRLGAVAKVSKALAPALAQASSSHPIVAKSRSLLGAADEFLQAMQAFAKVANASPADASARHIVADVLEVCQQLTAHRTALQRWTAWCNVRKRAAAHGLGVLVEELEARRIAPTDLRDAFELAYVRWWLPKAIDGSECLRTFQSFKHEDAIEDFRNLDDMARELAASRVRQAIAHELPAPDAVPRRSELGLLRHQMNLKRPSKTIREVISAMPESFGKLAPCLLMSPLSIAQYLPPDQALFDVVIFDEASQIPTWDAIGAIARGRQTIIVGDPKQLPPTNFFGRTDSDQDNEELEDHERDLESILDEAQASGLPTLQLNWHYRSRHESLIAFSNWHYYGNKLVTFPSAVTADRAVSLRYLPDAIYDGGRNGSRTNRQEADAIVAEAVGRMKQWLKLPEQSRPTLGVITFNSQQQSLIQDLFDQAQRDCPELEWFFADDRIEATVVKNLENVQGDERDVMFFSVTFGPQSTGKLSRNFGALNREGGERRLNVAVTRARQELLVFSSFKAEKLRVDDLRSRGVRDLKCFLDYAERGSAALPAQSFGSVGGYDSPFEEAVADSLIAKGWQIVSQVGVSGFRVDLGVVHPDKPGVYLAGVECDGATYHRSAAARDRDKTREQILRNLGWEIIRIWSPDWWYDSASAIERIDGVLRELLAAAREQDARPADPEIPRDSDPEPFDGPPARLFRRASLDVFDTAPELFFEQSYSETLRQMVRAVLDDEAPVREDVLAQRIARAHGFSRTGARIREHILSLLDGVATTEEGAGRFVWSTDSPGAVIEYRHPATEEDRRPIDEISLAELCGLIRDNQHLLDESDPPIAVARRIGVARLAGVARERIEHAIAQASSLAASHIERQRCDAPAADDL